MRINEVEDKKPSQVSTGARNGTKITTPYWNGPSVIYSYKGPPDGYRWPSQIQADYYARIKLILRRHNLKLDYIWGTTFKGSSSSYSRFWNKNKEPQLTMFLAISGTPEKPNFVWYKYEGSVPGGGQNHVYIHGQKIKMTTFMEMNPEKQDELLSTPPTYEKTHFPASTKWKVVYNVTHGTARKRFTITVQARTARLATQEAKRVVRNDIRKFEPRGYHRGEVYYLAGWFSEPKRIE